MKKSLKITENDKTMQTMMKPTEVAKLADQIERAAVSREHREATIRSFLDAVQVCRAAIESGSEWPAREDKLRSIEANIKLWDAHRFDSQLRSAVTRQIATISITNPGALAAVRQELERHLPVIADPVGPLHEKYVAAQHHARSNGLPDLIGSMKSHIHATLRRLDVLESVRTEDNVHEPMQDFAKSARLASTWIDLAGLHGVPIARGSVLPLFRQAEWQSYPRYVCAALTRALDRDREWSSIEDQAADDGFVGTIEMREQLKPIEPDASDEQRAYARKLRAIAVLLGIERTTYSRLSSASSIIERLAPQISERRRRKAVEPSFPGTEPRNRMKPSDPTPQPRRSRLRAAVA